MYSLNVSGVVVTHYDFSDGAPLCGFIARNESALHDWTRVTCRDCRVAR